MFELHSPNFNHFLHISIEGFSKYFGSVVSNRFSYTLDLFSYRFSSLKIVMMSSLSICQNSSVGASEPLQLCTKSARRCISALVTSAIHASSRSVLPKKKEKKKKKPSILEVVRLSSYMCCASDSEEVSGQHRQPHFYANDGSSTRSHGNSKFCEYNCSRQKISKHLTHFSCLSSKNKERKKEKKDLGEPMKKKKKKCLMQEKKVSLMSTMFVLLA